MGSTCPTGFTAVCEYVAVVSSCTKTGAPSKSRFDRHGQHLGFRGNALCFVGYECSHAYRDLQDGVAPIITHCGESNSRSFGLVSNCAHNRHPPRLSFQLLGGGMPVIRIKRLPLTDLSNSIPPCASPSDRSGRRWSDQIPQFARDRDAKLTLNTLETVTSDTPYQDLLENLFTK